MSSGYSNLIRRLILTTRFILTWNTLIIMHTYFKNSSYFIVFSKYLENGYLESWRQPPIRLSSFLWGFCTSLSNVIIQGEYREKSQADSLLYWPLVGKKQIVVEMVYSRWLCPSTLSKQPTSLLTTSGLWLLFTPFLALLHAEKITFTSLINSQAVVRQFSSSCQAVVRQLSSSCEADVKLSYILKICHLGLKHFFVTSVIL